MSQSLSANLDIGFRLTIRDTDDLNSFEVKLASGSTLFPDLSKRLTNGTTANKAEKAFYDQRTLASSANETLDLTALTDRQGAALAFTKLKWIIIRFTAAAGSKLTIGNAASDAFQAGLSSGATKDVAELYIDVNATDGFTVDSSHKNLKIANSGSASVTYDIILIGNV